MNTAEFAIKNKLLSYLVIFLSLVGGWIAYQSMPRFEDPEFTIRTAVIYTSYPGATPKEVAEEVGDQIETALQQLQEVEEIRSTSSHGESLIFVDVKYDFSRSKSDLDIVWTKMRNKVADVVPYLPPGAGTPIVNDEFGDVYGFYYALTADGYTDKELYDYARDLRTRLLSVEGIAKVELGGRQREAIYIEISRDRASALGVSVQSVFNDLAQQNSVISAGDVKIEDRRVKFIPTGDVNSVQAIGDTIISTPENDTIIRLSDVATISRDYITPASFILRHNQKNAISLGISAVSGSNVVEVGKRIEKLLSDISSDRPLGIELHEYYNQAKTVDESVRSFALNVLMALIIVLVTLVLFMGFKSAAIIGTTLILTIAATLATMNIVDIPMHRISLGALIIALGMLVDNAIVVTEGMIVGIQKGIKKIDIASDIVKKTKWPLLGGTIVGIIAFAPIGFAPGQTAEYTNHLFWVILISLLYSWIFAISLAPFFGNMWFKEATDNEHSKEGPLTSAYRSFITQVLEFKWFAIAGSIVLFAISLWGFQYVKSGFFPLSNTPQIVVDYWLPEGTDISETRSDLIQIETMVSELEGVEEVQSLIGAGTLRYMLTYNPEQPNPSYGQMLIRVSSFDIVGTHIPTIQTYLDAHFPAAQAKVWRFQLGPGGGSKIEAQFQGPDPLVLRQLANQAKEIMALTPSTFNIKDDWRQPVPVIEPVYNSTRGRRLGVSREDLATALASNFQGQTVGVYRENEDLIPIIARAPAIERQDVINAASIQVPSATTGQSVPLIEVVDRFDTVWKDARIKRVDRVWTIKAQSDPETSVLADDLLKIIRPKVEAIDLPPGYSLTWEGEYGESSEAQGDLATTIPLGLAAMVLTVLLLFNAIRQTLLIWFVVPLSLIGVVVGLVITGTPMEFMAILGILSLSGLLIKNAIVLVDQMDMEIRDGVARYDAVIDSAISRVRPVMMGAVTTILGIIPLLFDAFFKSMAVTLVFGLSFATLLTLLVVPALYLVFFNIKSSETEMSPEEMS